MVRLRIVLAPPPNPVLSSVRGQLLLPSAFQAPGALVTAVAADLRDARSGQALLGPS